MSDTCAAPVPGQPVTLITGGSTGIGAATARQLLELGHRVTVTGRRSDRLGALAGELGNPGGLLTIAGDAADYGESRRLSRHRSPGSGGWTRWWPAPATGPSTA